MRILQVTPYFAPAFCYGGPPRSVLGLCQGLSRSGVPVSVVTTNANGDAELPTEITSLGAYDGIPVQYLPRAFPKQYFRPEGMLSKLKPIVSEYDLVHIHGCWNFLSWSAAHACRSLDIPYVIAPRGMLDPWSFQHSKFKKWSVYHLIEKRNLQSASIIHATSQEECVNITNLDITTPTVLVPNGIDSREYAQLPCRSHLRNRYNISDTEFVVLALGRIHQVKGLEILGAAFEILLQRIPHARLLVVGNGEPSYIETLRKRFAHLLDSGRCIWTGHLQGKERLAALSAGDVLTLTSHSENFGLVVAEAMAAGLPIVLNRELPWQQVEQWNTGLRVENNPSVIAEALFKLATDENLRAEMGRNGRQRVPAAFDWLQIAKKMICVYEECLRAKGQAPSAKGRGRRAKSQGQGAKGKELRTGGEELRAKDKELRARS